MFDAAVAGGVVEGWGRGGGGGAGGGRVVRGRDGEEVEVHLG